ncbi:unnamed protein product [Psylliodes chrysocephalus]|uniref:Clip domain-containing protein n=1 Tax=Psylliodes chrysocephalus TaxID=3402493 RepID=A0A9P0CTK1_9CUCU|nr:unnamed protein product [Psylliodes chrysocephala]
MMWLQLAILSLGAVFVCEAMVVQEFCMTPYLHQGLCIPLQECPSIFEMASDFNTPMTLERLDFLIESQCGYDGYNPKVCCPVAELVRSQVN